MSRNMRGQLKRKEQIFKFNIIYCYCSETGEKKLFISIQVIAEATHSG